MAFQPDSPELEVRQAETAKAYDVGLRDLQSGCDVLGGGERRLHFLLPLMANLEDARQSGDPTPTYRLYTELSDAERFALRQVFRDIRDVGIQKIDDEYAEKLRNKVIRDAWSRDGTNVDDIWLLGECSKHGVPRELALQLGISKTLTARYSIYENIARVLFAGYGVVLAAGIKQRPRARKLVFTNHRSGEKKLRAFLKRTDDPDFWHLFVDQSNYDDDLTYSGLEWIVEQPSVDEGTLLLALQRLDAIDLVTDRRAKTQSHRELRLVERILSRLAVPQGLQRQLHCPAYVGATEASLPQKVSDGNPNGRRPNTDLVIEDGTIFRLLEPKSRAEDPSLLRPGYT